jgi:hypothetical protein
MGPLLSPTAPVGLCSSCRCSTPVAPVPIGGLEHWSTPVCSSSAPVRKTNWSSWPGDDRMAMDRPVAATTSWRRKQRARRGTLAQLVNHSHQSLRCPICSSARSAQAAIWSEMRAKDGTVTTSRFERRLPGGQHKSAFKLAFGTFGAAARSLGVCRTTIYRWSHDLTPLPRSVGETLADVIQNKVLEVQAAKNHLRDFLALPEKLPRQLSGACAGYSRKPKKIEF